jgi:Cu/Ag efflux protein CusF
MKTWTQRGGALIVPLLLWSGTALAQATSPPTTTPPNPAANTPEVVSGQVVKIDRGQGKVTIREGNGRIHEFQASADTLKDLKEGDRIEARLRH